MSSLSLFNLKTGIRIRIGIEFVLRTISMEIPMNGHRIVKLVKGQAVVEYAMIVAMVSLVATASLTLLSAQIVKILETITNALGG